MRRLDSRTWLALVAALATIVVVAGVAVADQANRPKRLAHISSDQAPDGGSWANYFGVQLEQTLSGHGKRVVNPKPGQLYFYTNSGTGWGATNTRNSVVIFDATDMKHWKHVATTDLRPQYSVGYSSHGATVSADGRWIYLQSMASPTKPSRLIVIDGFTLQPVKVFKTSGGFGGHHINNYTGPDGREYIMNVDFNWNLEGGGAWAIDPAKDQAIVGGISRREVPNPYVMSGDVGKYMYATVPAAMASMRGKTPGTLDKIDLTNWQVVGSVPAEDPIWVEPTQDGKTAWVTEGDPSEVIKVDLDAMKVLAKVRTGPGPWGARLSCDETQLFVADKGEAAGYNQNGRTITVVDTAANAVSDVIVAGRTSDHLVLSPDCKYVIASSNADHTLAVFDVETHKQVEVVKLPNDGDPHAGTFVRWKKDGKGGVVGEVVSTLTGLRGSARVAQRTLIERLKQATRVNILPRNVRAGKGASFAPTTVTVQPGQRRALLFSYLAGTSASPVMVASSGAGVKRFSVRPGQKKLVTFRAPSKPGTFVFTVAGDAKATPLVVVVGNQQQTTAARDVTLTANGLKWDLKTLDVKVGELIRYTIVNEDDEKHDLVNDKAGLPKSQAPDVGGGQTGSFDWSVPNAPGTYKFICVYHPWMVVNVNIKP